MDKEKSKVQQLSDEELKQVAGGETGKNGCTGGLPEAYKCINCSYKGPGSRNGLIKCGLSGQEATSMKGY